ncbi:hypothetical protein PFICI_10751 [Pestalotiopsis fici W106-1]|uniref:Uncharacterized protein n=1 Tax=Pestalotiopsis fici (strain W106-1 / CGMCC3.15140) TaxID=1229662 RepID=W3WUS5_PESFW|nr:uncharacterized protein PFICI_10751 [Pestalotiopsis fici W106-1]ETS76877.1 hypothetical protein PFICI_10751 [Pestalotiopsis fici W106-1]
MSIILLQCLALGGIVVYATLILVRPFVSPLRSIPGPFVTRFTDLWYLAKIRRGDFELTNKRLHDQYGPIVRYGPNRFSFATLDAGKIIYGHASPFPKSSWYSAWKSPGAWTLFADQNEKRHAANRRLLQHTYSLSSLVTYEPYVDECADLVSQRLVEMAHGGINFDLRHWLQCYAFDVIGSITYSKRLGFLDRGLDVEGVMKAISNMAAYASLAGIYSFVHPYIFPMMNYMAGSKGMGRTYVQSFTKGCIEEHQSNPKAFDSDAADDGSGKATDFLTKFYAQHTRIPDTFTTTHIMVACVQNMAAGSDTVGNSLSAIIYYLLKSPPCLQRLREELDRYQIVEKKVKFKDTQSMVYLQAVIKEALRLHPAAALPLERVVPEGGATISGRFFPEGTIVAINPWVEHRNTALFGNDADEFRPERWLTDDVDKLAIMNRHSMPFGSGSRTCIGRHIAMLEICKLVPRLMRDFDFELVGKLARPQSSWVTTNHLLLKPKDFLVNVKLRQT